MKNAIMYYYNLNKVELYRYNNKIILKSQNNYYTLRPIYDKNLVISIYNILLNNSQYDKIVTNINGSIYTRINGTNYILIKNRNKRVNLYNEIITRKLYIRDNNPILDKSNWEMLWKRKIDYYEYHQKYMKKYGYILESFNYYIGMAETAISYIKYNSINNKEKLVISHRRITEYGYFDPLNIIVDHRARDISQYLKWAFFNENYLTIDFDELFENINFTKNEYILLYGRMLFPCFYFDIYDQIINKKKDEHEISSIIIKANEYEKYISMIYDKINKIVNIPEIDWL